MVFLKSGRYRDLNIPNALPINRIRDRGSTVYPPGNQVGRQMNDISTALESVVRPSSGPVRNGRRGRPRGGAIRF